MQRKASAELTGSLLQLRDDEQRRVARELHDSVGQLLVAMSMNHGRALAEKHLSPVAAQAISENTALLAQVSREIRTISHLLHPPLLDEVGLAPGVREYLEGFAERSRMKVRFEIAEDFGRLPRDLETALFRIVQEGLTNVHRHSESRTVTIRIVRSSRRGFGGDSGRRQRHSKTEDPSRLKLVVRPVSAFEGCENASGNWAAVSRFARLTRAP